MIYSSNNIERVLNKEEVLRGVSQADIFRFYLNVEPVFGKLITSPLRKDNNPTCGWIVKRDMLYLKDFGTGRHLDCFNVVQELFGLKSFNQVLNKIYNDIDKIKEYKMMNGLKDLDFVHHYKAARKAVEKNKIQIETRDYRDYDLEWWNKFGIKESTLRFYNVYAVTKAYLNGKLVYVENSKNPCYAYYFPETDSIKLYQPFNKRYKWLSNTPHTELQGSQGVSYGQDLIITKSLKDVMTLREAGYNAVAVQSETSLFPDQLIEICATVESSGHKIYIMYDNDKPGLDAAYEKSKQYNIPWIIIPLEDSNGCKDASDYAADFRLLQLKQIIDAAIRTA